MYYSVHIYNEKRGHEFKIEQVVVYGRVWNEGRKMKMKNETNNFKKKIHSHKIFHFKGSLLVLQTSLTILKSLTVKN